MIRPNLPEKIISVAAVSADITQSIEYALNDMGISLLKVRGKMNCDKSVINHPDLYLFHFDEKYFLLAENICSLTGKTAIKFDKTVVEFPFENVIYPYDVFFNCVSLGNKLIFCGKHIHHKISELAYKYGRELINVKQGYTKCNICIVNENSIITEDVGIYKTLMGFGFDVLLLKEKCVVLNGYKYGFIGGASGKISEDKLVFTGNIRLHPEYCSIKRFLYDRDVEDISLSEGPLIDIGSILPVE